MRIINLDNKTLFAHEYVIDLDPEKAAVRAGFPANIARITGYKLMKDAKVREIILAVMKQVQDKLVIDAEKVLEELAKIGFSNIKDYIEDENQLGNIKNVHRKKTAAIESIQSETFFDVDGNKVVKTKLKLHSKLQALDMISKHIGFFEKDNQQKPVSVLPPPVTVYVNGAPPLANSDKEVDTDKRKK